MGGEQSSKISLYADNILCYLSQPEESIRSLRHIVSEIGMVSGYNVNSKKSLLWGLNLTEVMRRNIQEMWPGQWQDGDIRYLVLRISKTNEDMLLFLNTLLDISEKEMDRIQNMINKFIWVDKKPRVNAWIMGLRPEHGGLAVPNIRKYYYAALLVACIDWQRFNER